MAKPKSFWVCMRSTVFFPIDMLRYDCCYPADSADAMALSFLMSTDLEHRALLPDPVAVRLISSTGVVSQDRWRTFKASVVTEEFGRANSYTEGIRRRNAEQPKG